MSHIHGNNFNKMALVRILCFVFLLFLVDTNKKRESA